MGINVNVSKPEQVTENVFLVQFVGKHHIPPENEEFWNEFLKFNIINNVTR